MTQASKKPAVRAELGGLPAHPGVTSGIELYNRRAFAESYGAFQKALERHPGNAAVQSLAALAAASAADQTLGEGRLAQALKHAEDAVAAAMGSDENLGRKILAVCNRLCLHAAARADWKTAEGAALCLIKMRPPAVEAFLGQVSTLQVRGQLAEVRRLLASAGTLDLAGAAPPARMRALLAFGRYEEAFALGERMLDEGVAHAGAFDHPFDLSGWDAERAKRLKRLQSLRRRWVPWAGYYRTVLLGEGIGAGAFPGPDDFPAKRYGWMQVRPGAICLHAGLYSEAETRLRAALGSATPDWRARGFLAEALLCRGQTARGLDELRVATKEKEAGRRGEALAWLGELELWLGRYEDALTHLDEAVSLGALWGHAWRGATKLKLGRPAEALTDIDEGLRLYPLDREAAVWRSEALFALGRPQEALAALREDSLQPWAPAAAALAHAELGQWSGFESKYRTIDKNLVRWAAAKSSADLGAREGRRKAVAGLLAHARGYRREPFGYPIFHGRGTNAEARPGKKKNR